jgi:hypothetical protein
LPGYKPWFFDGWPCELCDEGRFIILSVKVSEYADSDIFF